MAPVLALAAVTFKKFAAIHNYDLVLNNYVADSPELLDPLSQQAKWQKVALLESLLPDYDLVVWMDADILITRFDKDIAKQVPQDCFQAFVLEQYEDRFNPHTAVWAMRNEEMSYNFLREVQLLKTQHSWAEPTVDS